MAAVQRASAEAALAGEEAGVRQCLLRSEAEGRLEDPIPTVADKWKLLPAFLKVRRATAMLSPLRNSLPHGMRAAPRWLRCVAW